MIESILIILSAVAGVKLLIADTKARRSLRAKLNPSESETKGLSRTNSDKYVKTEIKQQGWVSLSVTNHAPENAK